MQAHRAGLVLRAILVGAFLVSSALPARADLLLVRGDADFPPYEYLENGVPEGFNVDIMRAVASAMGMHTKIDLGPWDEVRVQLERGEIQVLMGMFATPDRDRLADFSSPHLIVTHSLFVRRGSSLRDLDDLSAMEAPELVVQRGDIMHDFALAQFPKARITPVGSPAEALKLLASGRHDAALLGKYQGQYLAQNLGLDDTVAAVGHPVQPMRYCLAVPEGQAELLAKLNEGLALIKHSGRYDEIHDKWFGVYEDEPATRLLKRYGLWALALLLVLLAGSLLWTWALRISVRQKTADLEREMDERLRAERELSESRKRFQDMVESSPLGSSIVDSKGRMALVNRAFTELSGYTLEDVPDVESWMRLAYPDPAYRESVRRAWEQDTDHLDGPMPGSKTFKIRCKDGSVRDVEFSISPLGDDVIVIFADVTERLRTEEALVQTEKMMSIGGLASGMAHEINNPLGGILQGIQNILRRISPDLPANRNAARDTGLDLEALHRYLDLRGIDAMLDGVRHSGERVAEIVADMLSFSRTSESRRAECDLRKLADKAIELASTEYGLRRRIDFRDIEVVRTYAPDLPPVHCTETEILQVFLNLLRNAAQALAEAEDPAVRPRIAITLARTDGFVEAVVEDNGPGIPENVRKRVFEPFFTTKDPGLGTGLGLSVSYFIVTRNHGGSFHVRTEPGKGAAFTFRLPLGEDEA